MARRTHQAPPTPNTPFTPSTPGSATPTTPGTPVTPGTASTVGGPGQPGQPQRIDVRNITPQMLARFPPEQRAQILAMQQRLREQQSQQAQVMAQPPPPPLDPAMQALLDSNFHSVPLKFADEERMSAVCKEHGEVTCDKCGTDFAALNELAEQLMTAFGKDGVPPPPPPPNQPGIPNGGARTQRMSKFKDDGNTMFKKGQHAIAARHYSQALDIATSRPPWEAHVILREELAMCLSNRSAAYVADGEPEYGLWDADAVIGLKRPWSKGHFRKAKALIAMARYQEAKESLELGLSFDPDSEEMKKTVEDVEHMSEKEHIPLSA